MEMGGEIFKNLPSGARVIQLVLRTKIATSIPSSAFMRHMSNPLLAVQQYIFSPILNTVN